MRPSLITLSQLAVLAKILCLLMVVMCGAVPSTVRSVSLYSICSRGNITVIGRSVRAQPRSESNAAYQQLTTQTDSFQRKIYIYAEKSKRYICFTKRWKMVAVPKKRRDEYHCTFSESYNGIFLRYQSQDNRSRLMGFNKSGNPVSSLKIMMNKRRMDCFNFIKVYPYSGVERHNQIVGSKSGMQHTREPPPPKQSSVVHKQQAQLAKHYSRLLHQQQQKQLLQQQQQQIPIGGFLMNSLVPSESTALQDNRQQQFTTQQLPHHHRHKHISHHGHKLEAHRRREQSSHRRGPNSSSSSSESLRAKATAARSKY